MPKKPPKTPVWRCGICGVEATKDCQIYRVPEVRECPREYQTRYHEHLTKNGLKGGRY